MANDYYSGVNRRSAYREAQGNREASTNDDYVREGARKLNKLIYKLERKYKRSDIRVVPEYEENGYVVKRINTYITQLDRRGGVKVVDRFSESADTDTYNDIRIPGANYRKKQLKRWSEYSKKLKNVKDEYDLMELDAEYEDVIDEM